MMPFKTRLLALLITPLLGSVLLLSIWGVLDRPVLARPLTFNVTTTADAGPGSLRQAILDSEANPGHDTISINTSGTLTVASPLPDILDHLTISGPGSDQFRIDGQGTYRPFHVDLANVTITNITLQRGHSDSYGGAILASGQLTLTNVHLVSNTASSHGGAVRTTGSLLVSDSLIHGNTSETGAGGALFVGGDLTLSGSTIISNLAMSHGGAIYVLGEADIIGSHFQQNRCLATNCDGGALFSFSDTTIHDSYFTTNLAQDVGGGVAAPGQLLVTSSHFEGNSSLMDKGGALFGQDQAIITASTFYSNGAQFGGGAIYMLGTLTMSQSLLQGNETARAFGGGLYVFGEMHVTQSEFRSNQATIGGGLYHGFTGSGVVENSLFANNVASGGHGQAILLGGSASSMVNHVTVSAGDRVSGTAITVLSGTVTVDNSIITSHTVGLALANGVLSQDYNLFFGNSVNVSGTISGGQNSVAGLPRFVDALAGDFHIQLGSMALDGAAVSHVLVDIDGENRPVALRPDIGADELNYLPRRVYLPILQRR